MWESETDDTYKTHPHNTFFFKVVKTEEIKQETTQERWSTLALKVHLKKHLTTS